MSWSIKIYAFYEYLLYLIKEKFPLAFMYDSFIGKRLYSIRKEILKISQEELAEELNSYSETVFFKKDRESPPYNQFMISKLEKFGNVSREKLSIIINFLYEMKRINPSWLLLKDNKATPKFLTKLIIDKNLIEKQKELQGLYEQMHQIINDVHIVIENSAHD